MFHYRFPDEAYLRQTIAAQANQPYSYAAVGATATTAPANYRIDHNRVCLGHGWDCFQQAQAAIQRWAMFDFGWIDLLWPAAPIAAGVTVGVLAHLPVGYVLNICRIVYVIDEEVAGNRRFGFAYGTLPAHVERGEERFLVEWNRQDESVWYDILAFSQPNHWLVKLGYPVTRYYQRRFGRSSKAAMQRAMRQPEIDFKAE